MAAPINMIDSNADSFCPIVRATINKVPPDMADNPPASPSIPSEKLMTLVTPKIQNMVRKT
ncbi:hypothetical protein D3C78_1954310 [compost metagenome]